MARDTTDQTPLTSVSELSAYLAKGPRPKKDFRIGTEHEKFAFFRADNSPVPYFGDASISALLKGMQTKLGWEPIMDGDNIIGLGEHSGMGAISIEPGGQFELSGAPVESIHETCRESNQHLAVLRQIAEPMGIRFLGIGGSPKWTLAETPRMPKSRYDIMTRYMPKVGSQGLDMMYRTCTIQVNLDFSSEEDMAAKMRVSMKLQSIATALFASSPSPKASRTGSSPGAAISGAIPTTGAPASCPSCSARISDSPTMWNGPWTCRCISSSATANITIARMSPSASS